MRLAIGYAVGIDSAGRGTAIECDGRTIDRNVNIAGWRGTAIDCEGRSTDRNVRTAGCRGTDIDYVGRSRNVSTGCQTAYDGERRRR